jgi:nitronate monooxygenase
VTDGARAAATAFTDLVGCTLPLQQAAMGGVTTVALAGAVAGEGGLGMLAAVGQSPDTIVAQHSTAQAIAGQHGRIGVGFLIPFLDLDALEAAAASAPIIECFYGEPDSQIVRTIHAAGALAAWQVGSTSEARTALRAGCDILILQGVEAGGHVRGSQPLRSLLEEVCPAEVPVVASGGIGSGRSMAQALDAGADAVRVGTRFVATLEADVHPLYASALVSASAEDTTVTTAFALGWPDAPHRVLRACIAVADTPSSSRSPLPPGQHFVGDPRAAALYAGTSVTDVRAVVPASQVIRELTREAGLSEAAPDRSRGATHRPSER